MRRVIMENKMISKDLIPRKMKQRLTGSLGYFNVWVGLAVIIATFEVGGQALVQINLQQTIIAGIVGCLILGVLIVLGGDIEECHKIPGLISSIDKPKIVALAREYAGSGSKGFAAVSSCEKSIITSLADHLNV